MIKKINVQKFGLFENYLWDSSIGRDYAFKKVNIIYGRNYSGKTTLSRIFRCIELSQLHNDYRDCKFLIKLEDGRELTDANFETFLNKVRVYNSDFVKDNLSWLHNNDGTIIPFTILGAKNVEIDKRLGDINDLIGNTEEQKGLLFEVNQKDAEVKKKYTTLSNKKTALNQKLTDKAREIKNKASIYSLPTYQINTLKNDIVNTKPEFFLADDLIESYNKLLKEDAKISLNKYQENRPRFNTYFTESKELLEKNITPSKPIADLINDSILQEWVRSGIDLHKERRSSCGFCRNPLPNELWKQLDSHFSKESEELRRQIQSKIEAVKKAKLALSDFVTLNKESFYSGLQTELCDLLAEWSSQIVIYNNNLEIILGQLDDREKDIFRSKPLMPISDNVDSVYDTLLRINILIDKNNDRTNTLATDKQSAKQALRLNEVAKFVRDIDYENIIKEIDTLQSEYDGEFSILTSVNKEIENLIEEKRKLEADAKDESRGAELVNQHLSHFFGHDELKLVAEGQSPNMMFKITRFNSDAKNLSEGECSLISFCYFIAKIEDELKEEANTNKLILYIDDPISSLDSNHVFFMFSLIESVIAKPQKYSQLFISTHNLDFLKYLKKLTLPKERAHPESKAKYSINHLMIERKSRNHSILRFAPDYLKNYITEFNYLFEQMFRCSEANATQIDHTYQYNFGNNTRKFLEAFLFYKYPSHRLNLEERMNLFFDNESVTINLINRVINEYSHLGEQFERGLEPIDEEVIKKIATVIVERMKLTDPGQYKALVESLAA